MHLQIPPTYLVLPLVAPQPQCRQSGCGLTSERFRWPPCDCGHVRVNWAPRDYGRDLTGEGWAPCCSEREPVILVTLKMIKLENLCSDDATIWFISVKENAEKCKLVWIAKLLAGSNHLFPTCRQPNVFMRLDLRIVLISVIPLFTTNNQTLRTYDPFIKTCKYNANWVCVCVWYSHNVGQNSKSRGNEHDVALNGVVVTDDTLHSQVDQHACDQPDGENGQQSTQDLCVEEEMTRKIKPVERQTKTCGLSIKLLERKKEVMWTTSMWFSIQSAWLSVLLVSVHTEMLILVEFNMVKCLWTFCLKLLLIMKGTPKNTASGSLLPNWLTCL